MDLRGVREFLGKDWTAVQELMSEALSSGIELLDKTNDSIRSHGGKQLRPMLGLLVARACMKSSGLAAENLSETSLRYAAASELLHNATLLHDDVADSSDMRRGVPTVRYVLGADTSVLVGDFWLVRAVKMILGDSDKACDTRVVRLFSETLSALAEGEMLQLQKAESADTDYRDYLRIIHCKTASLFEATAVAAAISTGASPEHEAAAGRFAANLGYAFQIKDDILDYCGTSTVGKPLGVDLKERKITLPLLGAIANSPEDEATVRKMVKEIPENEENVGKLMKFVSEHGGIEYADTKLAEFVDAAVAELEAFNDCEEKEILKELARYTAQRNK